MKKPAKFLGNSRLGSSVSSRKSSYSNKSLEPVLNTRMKNLSNFSFRYKDNEHERVVVQRSHTCRFRDLFCTWPLYIGVTIAMSILVLVVLLFSNPKSFTSYYETWYYTLICFGWLEQTIIDIYSKISSYSHRQVSHWN